MHIFLAKMSFRIHRPNSKVFGSGLRPTSFHVGRKLESMT